jgi:hypothetical protein
MLAWLIGLVLAPVVLPLVVLFDLVTNRRFPVTRTLAMFLVYATAEVAGVIASFGLWLRKILFRRSQEQFLDDNYRLQHWWGMTLYRWAVRLFSLQVEIDDTALGEPRQSIVFVRHVCVFDNLVPFVVITDRYGIRMRWAINRFLLRDPCLDIVGNRLPNVFVRNGRNDGARQVANLVGLLDGLGPQEGVQMFPEGAFFHPARRERALERLQQRGEHLLYERVKQFRGTLPPRLGGTLGLLESNPGADAIFIAHTGLEGAGSYRAILRGALVGSHVRVRAWRVPFAEIPTGREQLTQWFLGQWEEVDRFVQEQEAVPAAAPQPVATG